MITAALVFFCCLLLSAFFSGAEMAFVSANLIKFREMADSGSPAAGRIVRLQEHPQQFLTLVLIGNNVVNIVATAMVTYGLESWFGHANEWAITCFMAPLLIIFGETVPKSYCRVRSHGFLMKYSGLLYFMTRLFSWPIRLILRATDFFLGPLGKAIDRSIFVSEREFRLLIEESAKTGILEHHEKKLVDTILDFEKITVESVMTPVARAPRIEITGTVGAVRDLARREHMKMLLVYEELPSIVVGMVYVFDVLFETREGEGLKHYLRSPIFLPRTTSIEKAFLTLQEKRQSYAVVTDSDGEVIGVVAIDRLFSV